jgi:hypothetical protein
MTVYGSTTILNTYTNETSNLVLSYTGPGYALNVSGQATFASNVYAPTASIGTSNTQVATTEFVTNVTALPKLTSFGQSQTGVSIPTIYASNIILTNPMALSNSAGYFVFNNIGLQYAGSNYISNNVYSSTITYPMLATTLGANSLTSASSNLVYNAVANTLQVANGSFSNVYGTLHTASQPNVTSIGGSSSALTLNNLYLMYNTSYLPVVGGALSDETTVLTTSATLIIRSPVNFRLSSSKLPVFSLSTAANGTITLDILKNGTTIYATKPTITSTGTSSSGGVLTSSPTSFTEGDTICAYIYSTADTVATGLKITIYNS